MSGKVPWFVPRVWRGDTDRHTTTEWAVYCVCRIIGHRPVPNDTGHHCDRCKDTLLAGMTRRQA